MKPMLPPPLIALLIGFCIWLSAQMAPSDWTLDSDVLTILAIMIGLAGFALDGVSILGFLQARTTINPLTPKATERLVTSGFYRVSRNPMYLGMALLLTAWCCWIGFMPGLIWLPPFVWLITVLQIKPEEAALEAKFGEAFLAYKAKVRRWI